MFSTFFSVVWPGPALNYSSTYLLRLAWSRRVRSAWLSRGNSSDQIIIGWLNLSQRPFQIKKILTIRPKDRGAVWGPHSLSVCTTANEGGGRGAEGWRRCNSNFGSRIKNNSARTEPSSSWFIPCIIRRRVLPISDVFDSSCCERESVSSYKQCIPPFFFGATWLRPKLYKLTTKQWQAQTNKRRKRVCFLTLAVWPA